MKLKNMIVSNKNIVRYHDDYFNNGIIINHFPFIDVFGDFRIFNGVPLSLMDRLIGRLKKLMFNIAISHGV